MSFIGWKFHIDQTTSQYISGAQTSLTNWFCGVELDLKLTSNMPNKIFWTNFLIGCKPHLTSRFYGVTNGPSTNFQIRCKSHLTSRFCGTTNRPLTNFQIGYKYHLTSRFCRVELDLNSTSNITTKNHIFPTNFLLIF